jgi:hypothetical protein
MTLGTMGTDCEIRIDFGKLRRDRLQKAKEQIKKDGLGALLCFDPDSIRYITSWLAVAYWQLIRSQFSLRWEVL